MDGFVFNPPPGWPVPPAGWVPQEGWKPELSWPHPPPGWVFWVAESAPSPEAPRPEGAIRPSLPTVDASQALIATPAPISAPASPETRPAKAEPFQQQLADAQAEVLLLRSRVAELVIELRQACAAAAGPAQSGGVVDLDDERVLQEVGIYRYHHPVENSEEYRDRLRELLEGVKDAVKRGDAVLASDMFTFNNSLAKGRKMTSDYSKLMLRAYNSEADSCVRSLRAGNVVTAKRRLGSCVESVARLGSMMEMRINPSYHDLRLEELELMSDFLMKVQQEKEAAREERDRLREERKAEQELAAERERLDKERAHYAQHLRLSWQAATMPARPNSKPSWLRSTMPLPKMIIALPTSGRATCMSSVTPELSARTW
jgi:hypothetical protein